METMRPMSLPRLPERSDEVSVLLGITSTGWQAFCKQNMFTVHFLRRGGSMSLCRRRAPYQQKFYQLPDNAVICDQCRRSSAAPSDTRS